MRTETTYANGSDVAGGGNGDRFSSKTIVSIVLGIAGTVILLLATRWLDSVDRAVDSVKSDIEQIKLSIGGLAVEQARTNTKLEIFLQAGDARK